LSPMPYIVAVLLQAKQVAEYQSRMCNKPGAPAK
jgi:hypothetical protein